MLREGVPKWNVIGKKRIQVVIAAGMWDKVRQEVEFSGDYVM